MVGIQPGTKPPHSAGSCLGRSLKGHSLPSHLCVAEVEDGHEVGYTPVSYEGVTY
jgi:hypothetical protein